MSVASVVERYTQLTQNQSPKQHEGSNPSTRTRVSRDFALKVFCVFRQDPCILYVLT